MPTVPLIDVIGGAGAALTTLCWLPQAMKVMREKETRALSLPATAAFTAGIALWLIYGMAIDDWPLIGSNAATLALDGADPRDEAALRLSPSRRAWRRRKKTRSRRAGSAARDREKGDFTRTQQTTEAL